MARGRLFVISGPSGVGKGTVIARLLESDPNTWKSISATTRKPREGETDGVDYYFVERKDFERTAQGGGFLEWAEYSGNLYGTPVASVQKQLDAGKNVILEIEVQGAMQIREKRPDANFIFIAPPSLEVVRERLIGRGTETLDVIEQRLAQAEHELTYRGQYDYCVVNDDLDTAVSDFLAVVRAVELQVEQ